jgi:multimeric flavodoxin WrbA
MKIVGFIGSRRNNGNTATLVDAMLEGAGNEIDTARYILNESQFGGCQGCYTCLEEDRCSIDDQMQDFYEEIKQSDAVIIGSPIYFGHISGQTKLFMDRLFRFTHNPRGRIPNAPKPTIMVLTHGNINDSDYDWHAQNIQQYFTFAGFSVIQIYSVGGCSVSVKPTILTRPQKIETAKALGFKLSEFLTKD